MHELAQPINIFICSAHEDEHHVIQIRLHLSTLQRQHEINIWHNGEVQPGTEWEKEIAAHLNTSDIILLLLSSDFFASSPIHDLGLKAIERCEKEHIFVLPCMVRWVDIEGTPFSTLQMLHKAKPVSSWQDRDEAYKDIALELRRVIGRISSQRLIKKDEQVSLPDSPDLDVKKTVNTWAPGRVPNPSSSLSTNETPIQGGIQGEGLGQPPPVRGEGLGQNDPVKLTQPTRDLEFEAFSTEDSAVSERSASFLQRLFQVFGKQKNDAPSITTPDPTGVPRLPMSNRPVVNSYGKPYSMGMTLYEYGDHFDEVLTLSWSPNGQYIASGGKEIHIWEVVTGKCFAVYKGHTRLVRAIKWFSDRNCIASSDNYEAHIWNINMALINNRLLDDLSPHLYLKIPIDPQFIQNSSDIPTAFDLSPDSLQIIFGGKTYNSFTGNFLFDLGSAEETPCSAVYSPDGKYIAAGYQNAKVAIYSTVNGCSIDTSQRSETNLVTALAWSADGQYVAYGGSNRIIHLWHPHLNPFEPYVQAGSGPNGQPPPFRHLAPGEIPDAFTYFHNSEAIIALKFSSDGHYLASLTRDNVIKILEPFKWFLLYTKKGYPHLMNSNSIAWSPDSASIASISEGMTIEVWQTYVDARSKPAPLFFTKPATTPSNEESLRQSVQTKIKAHNRLMKTNIGALVVYGKDSQITQRVFVVSHQKLKNYPLVERDLYKLEAKEIERMQLLAHSRLPNPAPGVLCAKSQPIKCYTLKGQYIYAAVFEDLAPDDYLVWIDANNPVSVPVFSHQAASIDWCNTVSPKPSISPSAYEQQDK